MQSAYIHLYLIMINVITFALYGLDKWRAMTRQWRVREKIDHTCTDRRLHWSNDRYDSISS